MEIHVCYGTNREYRSRVRLAGRQKYELGKRRKALAPAIRDLSHLMGSGRYKRGDVILTADYYDPVQVVEMVFR